MRSPSSSRRPPGQSLTALGILTMLVGCGGEEALPSFDLAVTSDLHVSVAEGRRLVISASDGRVLLDGLGPAEIGDAPPLVGFALRDVVTEHEMQFGSFKPTEVFDGPEPSRALERARPADSRRVSKAPRRG